MRIKIATMEECSKILKLVKKHESETFYMDFESEIPKLIERAEVSVIYEDNSDNLIATAGWDTKICDEYVELSEHYFKKHNINPAKVAYLSFVAVDDKYRGKGLQRELIRWREIDSELHGFKYEMATVSPRNIASLKSLIREGYEPIAHAFLKSRNNVERLLMFRRSF